MNRSRARRPFPPAPNTPPGPTNLTVIAANGAVFVNWKSGGGSIARYVVSVTGQTDMLATPSGATWEKAVVTGITPGADGGQQVQVAVYAQLTGGGNTPAVVTPLLTVGKADPIATVSVAGDNLCSGWLGATIRVPTTGLDYYVPTVRTAYAGGFTTSAVVVGKDIAGNISNSAGTQPILVGCRVYAVGQNAGTVGVIQSVGNGVSTGFVGVFTECDGSTSTYPGYNDYGLLETGGVAYGYVGNFRAYYCWSHNAAHAFHLFAGAGTVYGCGGTNTLDIGDYAPNNLPGGGSHVDGIYTTSGTGAFYRYNRCPIGHNQTASIVFAAFGGNGLNLDSAVLRDCWIDGAGYALYTGRTSDTNTNATCQDNLFMRSFLTTGIVTLPANGASVTLNINVNPTAQPGQPIPANVGANTRPDLMPVGGTIAYGMDDGTFAQLTITAVTASSITATVVSGGGKVATPLGRSTAQLVDGHHTFNWHSADTFSIGQVAFRSGNWYISTINGNTGHDPSTDAVNWAFTPLQGTIRVYDANGNLLTGMWPFCGWLGPVTSVGVTWASGQPQNNVWNDEPTIGAGVS